MERLQLGEESVRFTDVEHIVELGQPVEERLAVLHGHAACEGDCPPRTGALPRDQLLELPEHFLLRVGADRARDEDGDVRIVERGFGDAADVGDMRGQLLAIGVIHLAADMPEVDPGRSPEHRHLRLAARRACDQRKRPETTSRVAEDRYLGWHRRSLTVCPGTHLAPRPDASGLRRPGGFRFAPLHRWRCR